MKDLNLLVPVFFFLNSCTSSVILTTESTNEPIIGTKNIYTQINLHPDSRQKLLYNVNYQQSGLIPVCTQVEVLSFSEKKSTFKVNESGEIFTYQYHQAAGETLEKHLKKVFDVNCPQKLLDKLSKFDKEGIAAGKPKKGMSKQALIFAMGYPTKSATPSTDSDKWKYWLNRFDTVELEFKDNHLVLIQD